MILERAQHGRVAVLTLNRPEAANSLTPELNLLLADTLAAIETEPETQVVILTGAGEKIFCAGMDLKAASSSAGQKMDRSKRPTPPILGFKKPIIAAVNGAAVGGGCELAFNCDLVVAVEHARFGFPEIKRGLFAAGGGTMVGTLMPLHLAMEMALTGDLYPAATMEKWGLLNAVVPAEQLLDTALELANRIAANAPLSLALTKTLVRRAIMEDHMQATATGEELDVVFSSEDAKEGSMAFMEKREPNWQGR
jgi:enoyl-CoA hydratase/carnithine racemase